MSHHFPSPSDITAVRGYVMRIQITDCLQVGCPSLPQDSLRAAIAALMSAADGTFPGPESYDAGLRAAHARLSAYVSNARSHRPVRVASMGTVPPALRVPVADLELLVDAHAAPRRPSQTFQASHPLLTRDVGERRDVYPPFVETRGRGNGQSATRILESEYSSGIRGHPDELEARDDEMFERVSRLEEMGGQQRSVLFGDDGELSYYDVSVRDRADDEMEMQETALSRAETFWERESAARGVRSVGGVARIGERAGGRVEQAGGRVEQGAERRETKLQLELLIAGSLRGTEPGGQAPVVMSETREFGGCDWKVSAHLENASSGEMEASGGGVEDVRNFGVFLECVGSRKRGAAQGSKVDSAWSAGEVRFTIAVCSGGVECERDFCHEFCGRGAEAHDWGGWGFEVAPGDAKIVVSVESVRSVIAMEKKVMAVAREGCGCTCQICQEGKVSHALVPCGHVFCGSCVGKFKDGGGTKCGMCRQDFSSALRLYI